MNYLFKFSFIYSNSKASPNPTSNLNLNTNPGPNPSHGPNPNFDQLIVYEHRTIIYYPNNVRYFLLYFSILYCSNITEYKYNQLNQSVSVLGHVEHCLVISLLSHT